MSLPAGRGQGRGSGQDPIDLLVARTRRRLALYTLVLVTALMLTVGAVTAVVATRLMHQTIDRVLQEAISTATRNTEETDERPVNSATNPFVVLLDEAGRPIGGEPAPLDGLPDTAAVRAAMTSGAQDLREGAYGGVHVRLLTVPATIPGTEDSRSVAGFAQAAYRLTLHDQQEGLLLWTIAITSGVGIVGAAIVTILVTRRALVPVRAAFATERRFVAAASHELRTPVAIVRASAEILQREALVRDDGQPLVADIVAEADRLGLLVTDLLTLASAEAGALTLDRQPVELVGWLGGLARRAETMAGSAGLAVVTELPDDRTIVVEADQDRLSQLLLILIDNAVEHSPAGGTITLGVATRAERAVITVRDQGPGVPAPDRERIFEPFARLPGRRRTASGSGLGLAIARQLAVRHGAELAVDDAPGGGARFTVRLPLAPAGVVAAMATGPGRA